jgi:hypothetical protein
VVDDALGMDERRPEIPEEEMKKRYKMAHAVAKGELCLLGQILLLLSPSLLRAVWRLR